MKALTQKVVNRGGPVYISMMDRIITRYIGGDTSPAFYDPRTTYPELLKIDENFEVIREELDEVVAKREAIRLVHETISTHPAVAGWRVLFIHFSGLNAYLPGRKMFPRTTAVLDTIPHVLDAWFSILEPGKSIPAHRGLYRGFLRYHTAFKVPSQNPPRLRVKNEYYTWRQRESVMFDDRHEHEVENESGECRVILIVDVLRPLPWPLHVLNHFACWIIGNLYLVPNIRNHTLSLHGDALEERKS